MSDIYRFICILDSHSLDNENKLSELDVAPGYLHIHILRLSQELKPIDEFSAKINTDSKNNILFQWGTPLEKESATRSEKVSLATISQLGQVGIGSAARGKNEQDEDFIGGGEAFFFDGKSVRVTKGDQVITTEHDQTYWTFQVADFNGAKNIDSLNNQKVTGRKSLMNLLKFYSGDKPFIATFDAEFEGDFFARSNGIFPEDKRIVENPDKSLFDKDINGGHLLGGSDNGGDVKSLKLKFSNEQVNDIDFSLIIRSNVILKSVDNVKIAKSDGSFRNPRTAIEVEDAAKLIQDSWRSRK